VVCEMDEDTDVTDVDADTDADEISVVVEVISEEVVGRVRDGF